MAYRTGAVCYIEIPARDVDESAAFYQKAFGWGIRTRGDGAVAFDDTTGNVSGSWVLGRPPMTEAGLMVYIMVADAAAAAEAVVAAGGEIVLAAGTYGTETLASFHDPAGNLFGIYQQPGLAEAEAAPKS